MNNILWNLIIGIITGVVSGSLVYYFTKRQEKKKEIYYFWKDFLFRTLDKCELYIPQKELRYISCIGDKNSDWYKAIYAIFDDTVLFDQENRYMTSREERIVKNVGIALEELEKWKNKH